MDTWIGIYDLKPGADPAAYAEWNRDYEAEVCSLVPGLQPDWQVYVTIDPGEDGTPFPRTQVFELMQLEDWRTWGPAWADTPRLQEIWKEFETWIVMDSLSAGFGARA